MKLALISLERSAADPPLGLAYLSSYIKKYSDHKDVTIIDKEDIVEAVRLGKFDLIGISAMTTDFKRDDSIAKEIKKITDVPLMIGGVHITIMPHHLKESAFDIGVIGEGERTLLELWNLFNKDKSLPKEELKKISGLVF
ncbi:MAG: cobalamin-dependent protein, partial [Nanoarchaeota archaeon]